MSKLERRFKKGNLSIKDLNSWLSGKEPLWVYDQTKKFWETDLKYPKVTVGNETCFTHERDIITVSAEKTLEYRRLLKRVGVEHTANDILRPDLGEEFTHYISFHHVPENFEKEYAHDNVPLKEMGYDGFLDAVSIGSQIEAIGFIGRKEIAKRIGIENHEEIENKIIEMASKENNELFRKATSDVSFIVLEQLSKISKKEGEKAKQELGALVADVIEKTRCGTGQVLIAHEFEEEYEGRFPKLIRKELEPEKKYKEKYLEFVGTYYPSFQKFLNDLFFL